MKNFSKKERIQKRNSILSKYMNVQRSNGCDTPCSTPCETPCSTPCG